MIKEFTAKFSDNKIEDVHQIGKRFYQIEAGLYELMEKTSKEVNRKPEHAGLFLGEVKRKRFEPSLPLLEMLGKISDKKIVVDDKAEWLFLCGRDIFGKSIVKAEVKSGPALIVNKKDEVLGLGNVLNLKNKKKVAVKNIKDMGDYLRREMSKRKKKSNKKD